MSVPFSATGTFAAGNVFTAQLSAALGNFTSPVNIGSLTSSAPGTISTTIPASTPAGTGYRIRVVSSAPAITGTDNGSDLTVSALPSAAIGGGAPICLGGSTNLSVALTGTGPWSVTYTDGTTPVTVSAAASPLTIPVSPASSKTYSLTAVSDANCTGTVSGSAYVRVNNPPALAVTDPAPACTPSTVDLASTISSSTTGLEITYWDADPELVTSQELPSPSVSTSGTYWIKAYDSGTGCSSKAAVSVTINSLGALAIGSPSGAPATTVALGTTTPTAYRVVSPEAGVSYTWSVSYNSGGSEVPVAFTTSAGNTQMATSWLSDIARVYKVRLTSSIAGCDAKQEELYVAVYDPSAGFVTGGGWITSPLGAYTPLDASGEYIGGGPSPEGKAICGFVSKYKKGSNIVEGNTEFHFNDGNLKFKSSFHTAATLVVSSCRATYKGEGTIEGSALTYKFMVSVVDGQINGGGNIDKFRIKITEKVSGRLVYDNLVDADENFDLNVAPSTVLGGGSIVIHDPKRATSTSRVVTAPEQLQGSFYSYPTAFSDKTTVAFSLEREEGYVLEVFDLKGALVKKIADGAAEANRLYEFDLRSDGMQEGIYLTRLTTASAVQSLKVVLKR